MNNKLNMYVVCVIAKGQKNIMDGEQYFTEFEYIEDVKDELKILESNGQNMEYVTVFPKGTGFLGNSFFIPSK